MAKLFMSVNLHFGGLEKTDVQIVDLQEQP